MPDLYPDPGLQPSTAELAETVRQGLDIENSAITGALSELVKRANGHVPVEALTVCQTELDEETREAKEAKKVANYHAERARAAEAERDRLAAALERWITTADNATPEGAPDFAREALNPGDGE